MLQGVLPTDWIPFSALTLVGQAWSLSLEWQFYLVAPFLFILASSLKKNWARVAVVAIAAICWIVSPYMGGAFVGNYLPMFGAGFLSYFAFKHVLPRFSQLQLAALTATSLAMTFILLRNSAFPLAIWIVSLFCVTSARITGGSNNVLVALLSTKVATYLGKISYPLYMVHMQVLFACMWLANVLELPMSVRFVALPVGCIVASIMAADILHRAVEAPCYAFGRRFSKRSY